jgi:acetolactate synthase regulatory subunit
MSCSDPAVFVPAGAPELTLSLAAVPTTHTLAAVLAVLHSRAADVRQLTWTTSHDRGSASIGIRVAIESRRRTHLCAALLRITNVTSVEMSD